MGVHAIDGMIDLCGPITQVYCQSFRQAVEIDSDDTTSMLFRMKGGMSGYLGTMTATGPGFSFQVFGTKGWVRLEGMTHVAGASSEERRTRLFGACKFQPVKGSCRSLAGRNARCYARNAGSFCESSFRWSRVSHPGFRDDSWCFRHRGRRSISGFR